MKEFRLHYVHRVPFQKLLTGMKNGQILFIVHVLQLMWINPLFYFRHLRHVTRSYETLYDVPIHKFRHAILGILRRSL